MECLICGGKDFVCIHNGTRDVPDVNVMKCTKCNMVRLDTFKYNTIVGYSEGGMLENAYSVTNDKVVDIDFFTWSKEAVDDDDRRYNALKDICANKDVLEFGCGSGGFLRRIKQVANDVTGIELMDEAREYIGREGIEVYKTIDEVAKKYDVVCMFNVIEHLNNPDEILKGLYNILNDGGIFICETVNFEQALLTKYECKKFEDFTHWSHHPFLFSSDTLEKLISRNGFETKLNTQMQRYSLANHLYWLSNGKPGGHTKWLEFNGKELNNLYAQKLIELGMADTLWYEGIKR